MEAFNEDQIDQMLNEEIAKLRTVIGYIEDNKAKNDTLSAELSEMKSRYETLSLFKVESEVRFAKIDELVEKRLSESNLKLQNRLTTELSTYSKTYKNSVDMLSREVESQQKTITRLWFYIIVSLSLGVISILFSPTIKILARQLAAFITG